MKNRREIVIYIAGPFRAENQWEVQKNIMRAEARALEFWREGFTVLCPHANSCHFQGAAPDEAFLSGDLEILRRCDAVFLIYGWQNSKGAYAEYIFAREQKIFVTEVMADLLSLYPQIDHEPSIANE